MAGLARGANGARKVIVALLGAESTGKSALAQAMAQQLQAQGQDAVAVGEYLREWCSLHRRTPRRDEQAHIAATQHQRILAASLQHELVLADTTALMTALYSEWLFADLSLYPLALQQHRSCDVTLLTGLDLPWQADGMQRDGAHVRAPVDALLRQRLDEASMSYRVVYGQGAGRLQNAMDYIAAHAYSKRPTGQNVSKNWVWVCDKCSDPACEHKLFGQLTSAPSSVATEPWSAPADGLKAG
jgi:nicotinamide riboside kinase